MMDAGLLARARAFIRRSPPAVSTPAIESSASSNVAPQVKPEAIAAALCRRFEGLHLRPYLCPAGVPTIGYGATYYEDGRKVTLADPPITRERAEALLQWMLRTKYLPPVLELCPGAKDPAHIAALVDFTYNLGAGALRASTLRRRVNDGRHGDVPHELRKWVNAGGRRLRGLVRRREAEIAVWDSAK